VNTNADEKSYHGKLMWLQPSTAHCTFFPQVATLAARTAKWGVCTGTRISPVFRAAYWLKQMFTTVIYCKLSI